MKGILRFNQGNDSWYVETEDMAFSLHSNNSFGTMPTDILMHDGTEVDFKVIVVNGENDMYNTEVAVIIDYKWD